MAQFTPFRGGGLEANVQKALGDLGELTGTWMGNGFSLVSLPDPDKDPPFRLQLNATKEILNLHSHWVKSLPSEHRVPRPALLPANQRCIYKHCPAPGSWSLAADPTHEKSAARGDHCSN